LHVWIRSMDHMQLLHYTNAIINHSHILLTMVNQLPVQALWPSVEPKPKTWCDLVAIFVRCTLLGWESLAWFFLAILYGWHFCATIEVHYYRDLRFRLPVYRNHFRSRGAKSEGGIGKRDVHLKREGVVCLLLTRHQPTRILLPSDRQPSYKYHPTTRYHFPKSDSSPESRSTSAPPRFRFQAHVAHNQETFKEEK